MGLSRMNYLGVFEGGGGFSLAAEKMGWNHLGFCEWNPFCQRVLKYYWPHVKIHGDIRTTDFKEYANRVDVFTGGFPCQPVSTAGEQKGKDDERYLFPEMLRAIREVKPRWIVAENVSGLIKPKFRELFEEICTSLEYEGYEVFPIVIPASAVGAPHERYRVWIVAHSNSIPRQDKRSVKTGREESASKGERNKRERFWNDTERNGETKNATDTFSIGQSKSGKLFEPISTETLKNWEASWSTDDGGWPTQSPICSGHDGFSGKLDGITLREWREETGKLSGNAVVYELALQIFKAIEQYELWNTKNF
jgi:DNA (cytosine-5)-methyltransferase 1